MEIVGQLLRTGELIHMDIGAFGGAALVVLRPGAHHDRQHVLRQAVHVELLRDVVATVGVFKGEVELVVAIEYFEAFLVVTGTLEGAARAVYIHLDVVGQFAGVGQTTIAGAAVRYEPGDFFRFVRRVIPVLNLLTHLKHKQTLFI